MAINKFTKWIEAEPTREIRAEHAIKFMKGIFCRYGLPHRILIDNGSQFTSGAFQDYCLEYGVKICFTSVSHPQSNGQVERATESCSRGSKHVYTIGSWPTTHGGLMNSLLFYGLSAPLGLRQHKRHIFFSCTDPKRVLPTELRYRSTRVREYSDEDQETRRTKDVNLLEEHRECIAIRAIGYQQNLLRYHEKRVQARTLDISDYVRRRVQNQVGQNKLSPKCEGPYTVVQVLRPGAYKIADDKGRDLSNSWNIDQLRKFYV